MNTEKPPVFQTVATAWHDVFRAVNAMPVLALIVTGISIVFSMFNLFVLPHGTSADETVTPAMILALISTILRSFFLTPFLIAVHRFILLNKVTADYPLHPFDRSFQRFFGWSAALSLLSIVPSVFQTVSLAIGVSGQIVGIVSFALVVMCIFLTFRLTILFPAIAIDARGATAANAYADTRGNVWRILFIFMLASLPFMAVAIVFVVFGWITFGGGKAIGPGMIAGQLVSAALGVFGYALFVAIASRLFQVLGKRVLTAA